MENKLIEIQDLQVGDEIMISCQSYFKYLRVLTPPTFSKTKTNWQTKKPSYANFRCTTRQEEVLKYSYTNSQGQVINRMDNEWIPTPEDHNLRISQDLNGRQIWLVKRGTEI
jgi:hypothetical protein